MKKYALYIVLALTFIACVYAYFQFLKPLDVFLWDESHHGFYGMQIYNDLRARDLGAFWAHTNNQALWMPLHSWFDGIFLLILGFSYTSARLSSLFLFFACSILIYLIGLELSKEKGWIIGSISSALFLTSPMMLHLATVNMQEMLGIFICLSTYYFIIRHISVEAIWKYLTIGLLLGITYWAKLNFALQAVLGIGAFYVSLLPEMLKNEQVDPVRSAERKKTMQKAKKDQFRIINDIYSGNPMIRWFINGIFILSGFLPLFVLWWATPPFERKFGLGFMFWRNILGGGGFFPDIGFGGRTIFYIQSLVTSYGFSFWLGLGCLAAFTLSFAFYKDHKIRLASFMFIANMLMISYPVNIQERYVVTAPLMFLLLAYFSVNAFDKIKSLKRNIAVPLYIIIAIFACAVGYDALSLTRYTKEVGNRSILSPIYKDSLNHFSPPFLFGLAKRPAFTYPMDQIKKYKDFKETPKSSIRDVLDFFSSNIERNKSISTMISYAEISPYVIYWHFQGWGAPVMSVNDLGFNPRYFWMADYFLDIQASEGSPYYSDLLDKRWNDVSKVLLKEGVIRLAYKKEFTDLGLTAKIYKREKLFYFR